MVFLQKGELPFRTDKGSLNLKALDLEPTWENLMLFRANYTYTNAIENYNRLYHYPELLAGYTTKQSAIKKDKAGAAVKMWDSRISAFVSVYSYVQPGNEGDKTGNVSYTYAWPDQKQKYYDWVQHWLYSEDNNVVNTPCEPPYTNFSNPFCLDLKALFATEAEAPVIFKCFVGILPHYCPWKLDPATHSVAR